MFSRTFLSVSYRISPKSNLIVQKITSHKFSNLTCQSLKGDFIVRTTKNHQLQAQIFGATFLRYQSNESTTKTGNEPISSASESSLSQATEPSNVQDVLSQIPEPPQPILSEVIETIAAEPTLQSLGLGSNWPPGLIQKMLDFMQATLGIPWWGTIVLTTICVRLLMFPIVIKTQRYTAKMHNVQPQLQYLQMQLAEARKMGDHIEVAQLSNEMYLFMKEKGIDPIKNAALPLIQAPIFISFFMALRGMVHAPVESMKTGGMMWFPDLTVPDPYYLLPILTSTTLFITIRTGTDFMRMDSIGTMRYVFQAMPFVMFPFIINFEGAILCYWVSTNIFSLIQVTLLRTPKVRTYFKIPETVKHDTKKLPLTQKNFVEGFKDSWTNMKVARELNSRVMYDESIFEKAGKGPVPKTYRFDPTRRQPEAPSIFAKKRD